MSEPQPSEPRATITNSQVGVVGDHAHIEGGIHFHGIAPGAQTPPLDPETALARYREGVLRRHGTTRIFGQPEAVSVEGIFTHLNILEKPRAWERDPQRRGKCVEGVAYVTAPGHDRLVILGKPGAGKTTFLRYLAVQAAKGEINRVPVLIALKDWAMQGRTLMDALVHEFTICGVPDAEPLITDLLAQGRALLLFDALDEVAEAERPCLLTTMRDAGDQYPQCKIFITYRNAATEYQFERYQYVEVADFDKSQIETFIGKWFQLNVAQGEALWRALNKKKRQGVLELAQTPLLLALFCIVFNELGELPACRSELYHMALDALLKRWDELRGIQRKSVHYNLLLKHKHALLAYVAYHTFERGEIIFSQKRVEALIGEYLTTLSDLPDMMDFELENMLQELVSQQGILVQVAQKMFFFSHLTLHEYYVAYYTTHYDSLSLLPNLFTHAHEEHWRGVVLIIVSMVPNVSYFYDRFLHALDGVLYEDKQLISLLSWGARTDLPWIYLNRKAAAVRSLHHRIALDQAYHQSSLDAAAYRIELEISNLTCVSTGGPLSCTEGQSDDVNDKEREVVDLLKTTCNAVALLDRTLAFDSLVYYIRKFESNLDYLYCWIQERIRVHSAMIPVSRYQDVVAAFVEIHQISSKKGNSILCNTLDELHLPDIDAPLSDWYLFEYTLQAIITQYTVLTKQWAFTKSQITALTKYYEATISLIFSLDEANLSEAERDAILDRLLLPPELPADAVPEHRRTHP